MSNFNDLERMGFNSTNSHYHIYSYPINELSIIRVNVLTLKGYECTYIDLNSEFKQVIKYFSDWNLLIDYIKTILPK